MTSARLLLGTSVLLVVLGLRSATREVASVPAQIMVWVVGIGLLTSQLLATLRAVRRLPTASLADSQRAVLSLVAVGLVLVFLALTLPVVLTH